MNLDELQSIQSKERKRDSLQHLRDSFYEEAGAYVADMKARRETAAAEAEDPFASPEVRRLTDEIETAKDVVQKVYDRRMGKIVKHASLVAAGMPPDEEGMTSEERDLFGNLVETIEDNKETVLDTLAGERASVDAGDDSPPTDDGTHESDGVDARSDAPSGEVGGVSAADLMGTGGDSATNGTDAPASGPGPSDAGGSMRPDATADADDSSPADDADPANEPNPASESRPAGEGRAAAGAQADRRGVDSAEEDADPDAAASKSAPDAIGTGDDRSTGTADAAADDSPVDERVTVKVTADVGEILGVDQRSYDLAEEDVVTLPERNATVLVERGGAERLE